jgi:hypothetical protein
MTEADLQRVEAAYQAVEKVLDRHGMLGHPS